MTCGEICISCLPLLDHAFLSGHSLSKTEGVRPRCSSFSCMVILAEFCSLVSDPVLTGPVLVFLEMFGHSFPRICW